MTTSTRSHFAQAIALTGVAAMLVAAVHAALTRQGVFQWLTPAVAIAYVLWVLSEWRITTAGASQDTRTDRFTCEAYASARFITMLAAFVPAALWSAPGPWLPAGLALFAGGIALRGWAIVTLGRAYSHRVRTPEGSGLVSHGPYRHLRHPAYSGMLMAHVGIALLFFNLYVVLALGLALLPALVRRIQVEEAHLLSLPGYADFAAVRARLAPGVW
ncbi:methyltransferase family protein [Sphaerotilaceae bacterium SBD11-9]